MKIASPGGSRAQSSTIGVVLLFGLIITGAGLVVVAGTAAITDTQATSDVERASQELTLFDSRAAMVALGSAESQSIRLSNGDYTVNDSAGRMIVEITNETNNNTEVIYNGTIGTFLYQNDDVEIAYQGGGVWRRDENGGATMVSPPEFHFRRATLTLPVINVINSDSAGGSVQAQVQSKGKLSRFYPNASSSYANMTGEPYLNPIKAENWTGTIRVESRYAPGWYEYFLERTGGNATLVDEDTAQVELRTLSGDIGPFPMPNEGNALDVTGVAGGTHAIKDFSVNITSESGNSKDFVELPWSMYVDRGNVEFEVRISGDHNCKGSGPFPKPYPGDIVVDVYYRNETESPTVHEEWTGRIGSNSTDIIDAKCLTKKKAFASIHLVKPAPGSTSTNLTYDDITINGNKKMKFESAITSNSPTTGPTSFDRHPVDNGSYSITENESMGFVVDHYLSLIGPKFDLTVRDGPGSSSRVDEGVSSGMLRYEEATGSQFLTYLHITENNVTVDVGG